MTTIRVQRVNNRRLLKRTSFRLTSNRTVSYNKCHSRIIEIFNQLLFQHRYTGLDSSSNPLLIRIFTENNDSRNNQVRTK